MATLTVQQIASSGLEATYVSAASGGDEFAWGARTFLHVKNGDASSHTVTIASQRATLAGYTVAALDVAVPAGEDRMIGPLPEAAYADGNDLVQVTYDAVTSVTVAALTV